MKNIETIIDDLCKPGRLDSIEPRLKQRLYKALAASLVTAHSATDEPEELHSFVPIHTPVLFRHDEKTGNWQIRFPLGVASGKVQGWHVLDIEPDALVELAGHIYAELRDGRLVMPTPPKSEPIQ